MLGYNLISQYLRQISFLAAWDLDLSKRIKLAYSNSGLPNAFLTCKLSTKNPQTGNLMQRFAVDFRPKMTPLKNDILIRMWVFCPHMTLDDLPKMSKIVVKHKNLDKSRF